MSIGTKVSSLSAGHIYLVLIELTDGDDYYYSNVLYYYYGNGYDYSTIGSFGSYMVEVANGYVYFRHNSTTSWSTVTSAYGSSYSTNLTYYLLF